MPRDPLDWFTSDSQWGSRRPRGWGGTWLKVAQRLPASWPWGRFALLARRLARARMRGPVDVRVWGFKLRMKPHGSVSEARMLFLPRCWDRLERRALAPLLGPGSVLVDVGANAGGYVFWAASLHGGTGRALAFEPDPALARQLRWNVAANAAEDRIAVVEAAVAAEPGTGTLLPGIGNSGENRLAVDHVGEGEGTSVRVVALADAVREAGLVRIDCLKVDVEGREADVLMPFFATAPAHLRPRTLLVEMDRRKAANAPDLDCWIAAQGYRLVLRTGLNGVYEMAAERGAKAAAEKGARAGTEAARADRAALHRARGRA